MLTNTARDPFSTPCEKAIPESYYPFLVSMSHLKYLVLVVSIGVRCRDTMAGFTIFSLVLDLRGFKNRDSSHENFQIAHGSLTKVDIQWKLRGNHILKFHKNLKKKMWDVKKVMFYCDTKFQVEKHYEMWAMKKTNSALNSDITIRHYSTLILSFS